MRTLACCRGRGLGAPFAAAPSSWPGRPRGSVFESVCHGCRWKTVVDGRDLSAPPACPLPALLGPRDKMRVAKEARVQASREVTTGWSAGLPCPRAVASSPLLPQTFYSYVAELVN